MIPEQTAHNELCRNQMRYAHQRMRATFLAVPEDKVDWSPTPTAKSALHIVSHCVDANTQIARALMGGPGPQNSNWEFKLSSKEEALRELDRSVAEFDRALEIMSPELYASSAETPVGAAPLHEIMHFMGFHLAEHAGQIDYLQTCWDDQESRYPEN
ncbi:MAG: DinB family protein [Fimbriimonadaceae bacterium]